MNFRTTFDIPPAPVKISLQSRVFSLGSCFAETMGKRLIDSKLQALVNPFGILFHPAALHRVLKITLEQEGDFAENLIAERDNRFFHYDVHSGISGDSPPALLQKLRHISAQTAAFLQKTDFLLLTLGTAFAYRLLAENTWVANCHKMPGNCFEKNLLSVAQTVHYLSEILEMVQQLNPQVQVVLTVSPVRHLKDTLPLNQVSKSVLRLACHELVSRFPDHVSYFPAYEWLLDDLRDYRFYKPDMLHPSETAETYLWEKFSETYFHQELRQFLQKWEPLSKALAHQPFDKTSAEYQVFTEKTLKKLNEIRQQVDVEEEIKRLEK